MQRAGHYITLTLLASQLVLAIRTNLVGAGIQGYIGSDYPIIRLFGQLTGAHCGYGFFAPQVASPCYVEIGLWDASHPDRPISHTPRLSSNEARLRYHSFTTLFLDLAPGTSALPPLDSVFAKRLARAFARSIAERESVRAQKRLIFCRVYVYRHPRLRTYPNQPSGTKHILYEYQYPPL